MKTKTEFQYKRLFQVIGNRSNNKVWGLKELFKAVNFLLPDELTIVSIASLAGLIKIQSMFKVFRCRYSNNSYYIFKKHLPGGE